MENYSEWMLHVKSESTLYPFPTERLHLSIESTRLYSRISGQILMLCVQDTAMFCGFARRQGDATNSHLEKGAPSQIKARAGIANESATSFCYARRISL